MNEKQLLGARIQELRKSRHWTQEVLAEKLDISLNYVSGIERGRENPTLDMLVKFAKVLNVELWEMCDFRHEDTPKELRRIIRQATHELKDEKLRMAAKILLAIKR